MVSEIDSIYKIVACDAVKDGEITCVEIHYKKGNRNKVKTLQNMEYHETRSFGPVFKKKETAPAECQNCFFYLLKRFFHIA